MSLTKLFKLRSSSSYYLLKLFLFFNFFYFVYLTLLTRANTGNSSRYDCDWGTIGGKLGRNCASSIRVHLYCLRVSLERYGWGGVNLTLASDHASSHRVSADFSSRGCPHRSKLCTAHHFSIRNLRLSESLPPFCRRVAAADCALSVGLSL